MIYDDKLILKLLREKHPKVLASIEKDIRTNEMQTKLTYALTSLSTDLDEFFSGGYDLTQGTPDLVKHNQGIKCLP